MTSVATLFLAAAVSAGPWEALLVFPGGDVERRVVDVPLVELELGEADRAWLWREDTPPFRVTRQELGQEVLEPDTITSARFVVRGREKVLPEGLRLVAAPAAMWEDAPERLLPSFAVPPEGTVEIPCDREAPWRARVHGGGFSSAWIDVQGCRPTQVRIDPATSRSSRIIPAAGSRLRLLEGRERFDPPRLLALFDDDGRGRVTIPDAPPVLHSTIVAQATGAVPHAYRTPLDALPSEIRLDTGAEVSGRTVLADGEPARGALVRAEWWIEGIHALPGSSEARSDETGAWTLRALPRRDLMLVAELDGYATARVRLSPQGDELDAGDLVLSSVTTLRLEVFGTDDRPAAGVTVFADGQQVLTDQTGIAELGNVASDRTLRIALSAKGFVRESVRLPPPLPERHRVTLTPSFRVRGRFLDTHHEAPPGILLVLRVETRESQQSVAPDGSFDLDLTPDVAMELVFLSATTQELRVPLPPGRSGETRELGNLVAPRGAVISGRIVDARDYTPVQRARVWTLRPSAAPNTAFARDEVIEAFSDVEGVFELSGLDSVPTLLRIDAGGYARRYRDVVPEPPPASNDLSDVTIGPGARVRVEASEGDRVRLDLRGNGWDADVLNAAIIDGVASLNDVPAGEAWIEVLSGRNLLCETTVDVPPTTDEIAVPCKTKNPLVRGDVSVGSRRGAGMLVWRRARASQQDLMVTRHSPSGLPQSQLFGTPRGEVTLFVSDGRFETRELMTGRWRVEWLPDKGGSAGSREVVIDDRDEQYVAFRYGDGRIDGMVVDAEGAPVPRAGVVILESTEGTMSGADGSFSLTGLSPGRVRLEARQGHRVSDGVDVEVREGRTSGPVRLTLVRDGRGEIRVTVQGPDQSPAGFALVFLDFGGPLAIATANPAGVATFQLPKNLTAQVRAASSVQGQWAFGDWSGGTSLALEVGATGALTIVTEAKLESVHVTTPAGWDLTALFSRLGVAPQVGAGRPLVLGGLPPGTYVVRSGTQSRSATVERGKNVTISLR